MSGKRAAVRADLTNRLLEAATARIERGGLGSMRARDVTADAGCGLGKIYKCYEDLDDLIIHVNSGTLARLRHALQAGIDGVDEPALRLKALAKAYLQFARDHTNLWLALFQHRLPGERTAPDWHVRENTELIGFIARSIAQLEPEISEDQLAARARTYFAAVHGIVLIGLQGKFVAPPEGSLDRELEDLVGRLTTFETPSDG
ncbi:MAG: TetR-like C-terminal domain-containing protein [Pseudomonadota bacterium]